MIKIKDKRYNPDAMQEYFPSWTGNDPTIIFVWKNADRPDTVVKFQTEEERDKTLAAMDQVMLMVNDGVVVERTVDSLPPFIFEGGDFGGPGGIPMQ
jgi:6-phosphogluconate dehydrogenase